MAKICRDFGPASDCCPSCHDGVHIGEQDLLVIYGSDGSVYANVCCKVQTCQGSSPRRRDGVAPSAARWSQPGRRPR